MKDILRQHLKPKEERAVVVTRALGPFALALVLTAGCRHKDAGSSVGTPTPHPGADGGVNGATPGADASMTSPGVDGGVTIVVGGTICEQSAPAYCAQWFKCDPKNAKALYGNVEGCAVEDASTCRWVGSLPGASPKAMESWAACNRALGVLSCEEFNTSSGLEACRTPAGAHKAGEACSADVQCATSYCKQTIDPDTHNTTCSVCAPAPGVGQPCGPSTYCDFGLSCSDYENGGVCVRPAPEGGQCDPALSNNCLGDLTCRGGRCQPKSTSGGPCIDSRQCAGDLVCLNGACGSGLARGEVCDPKASLCDHSLACIEGVCSRRLALNEACEFDWQCASDLCHLSAFAGDPQVCEEPTEGTYIGQSCAVDAIPSDAGIVGANVCWYPGFCDEVTRHCVGRRPPGQPCASDDQCYSHLTCTNGTCQLLAPKPDPPACPGP
jgi:hypothetical protein